jgi:hypothetical protein
MLNMTNPSENNMTIYNHISKISKGGPTEISKLIGNSSLGTQVVQYDQRERHSNCLHSLVQSDYKGS